MKTKVKDLTIKQIIEICNKHLVEDGFCDTCPLVKLCEANFAFVPKNFRNTQDEVDISVDE